MIVYLIHYHLIRSQIINSILFILSCCIVLYYVNFLTINKINEHISFVCDL